MVNSPLEVLRSQIMSTRTTLLGSLNVISTQRESTLNAIRQSLTQGQTQGSGGLLGAQSILGRIQSIRSGFMAPTAQQAGAQQQGGILGGGGLLGALTGQQQPTQPGQQPQGVGILGRIQQLRQNLTNPQQPGVTGGVPASSFLNAPPEQTGAIDTPTPMGVIPTDTNVQNLAQKGLAPTSLGHIEVN